MEVKKAARIIFDPFSTLAWLNRSALFLGIIVALVGALVLFGWQYDYIRLEAVISGVVPMNPLTAVEFILCGLAVCLAFPHTSVLSRRISFFLAFLIIILAVLKIVDLFGFNVPADRIIFADKLGNFSPASRMSPITAINFVAVGLAIFLLDKKFLGRSVAQYLALFTGSFAIFMLLAYLFGSSFQSNTIFFRPLAFHTAINFILLALAIIFLRPDVGLTAILFSSTGGGLMARRLMPAIVAVPIVLAFFGNYLINIGLFDFQLGFALILVINIVFFEYFNYHYSQIVIQLEEAARKTQQIINDAKSLDDALLSSIGDGVVATDRQGVVTFLNPAAEKMFDIKASKAIGKSIFKLWTIFDKEGRPLQKKDRPVQVALITGKSSMSSVSEPYYYSSGGKKIPVAITVTPVIVSGRITGVIDVFRDISRDVEIDKTKSEFVSFASHQLRTPSTAIGWQIEMYLDKYADKLDAEQKDLIKQIYDENHQMSELITDFLSVSKIEYGILPVESKPINLEPLITSIIKEQLKDQIAQKKLQVEEKVDRGLCVINADINLYRLIIENLLTNAIKYTPENGRIVIELTHLKPGEIVGGKKIDKDVCVLIVSDSGIGISADEQDKIFTKFYRTNLARDMKIPGTGLGLYMVKLFIQKMGGDIWFESEEGKGTKFFVRL